MCCGPGGCCEEEDKKKPSSGTSYVDGKSQQEVDEEGRAGKLRRLRKRMRDKALSKEERAAAKREFESEAIVLYGRKFSIFQRLALLIILVLKQGIDFVPIAGPVLQRILPFGQLKLFLQMKWQIAGASFHGRKIAFACTFGQFFARYVQEVCKTISTLGVHKCRKECSNDLTWDGWLDAKISWEGSQPSDVVDVDQMDFVFFRTEKMRRAKLDCCSQCVQIFFMGWVRMWWNVVMSCCCAQCALDKMNEELDQMLIGGQALTLKIVRPKSDLTGEDDMCCTEFHCLLVKHALSCGICGGDAYNQYVDDHLEWTNGDDIIKTLQQSDATESRRISQFGGVAAPANVAIDVQPAAIDNHDQL